jgi:putative peptidoglycan lipid II flippase
MNPVEQTPETAVNTSKHSVARSASIVSIAVMGSRVLGLVREQVFAYYFGAGFLNDAFQIAFRIPNTLRDLFAEGALSIAFVKTFSDYIEKRGEQEAWRLANLVMNGLAVVLGAITLAGIFFAPQIVSLIAVGFSPEKSALAITLTRIMFPFLMLVGFASVAMGVLNSRGRFGLPASASTLFNVGSIVGGLACAFWLSGGGWKILPHDELIPTPGAQWAIIGMAIGTLIGGLLQFVCQIPSMIAVGFRFRPAISFSDLGVRQVMGLMGPAIIGTAAIQINVFVDTFFASSIPNAPSWLAYSFRLMQFPIGVFGVAVATATIPEIARHASRNNTQAFRETLSSSIGLVFLLTIPAACGLAVLGQPIIRLLYERGAFSPIDTRMVTAALIGWSVGLVGYAAIKVLSPAFYTLNKPHIPMIVSLASIAVNAITDYLFMRVFSRYGVSIETPNGYGHVGLALSTSCVAIVNFLVLALLMRRLIRRLGIRQILKSFIRILLASLALSVTGYSTYQLIVLKFGDQGFALRLMEVFIPMCVGGSVFVLIARLLRIGELDTAIALFSKRFRRIKAPA